MGFRYLIEMNWAILALELLWIVRNYYYDLPWFIMSTAFVFFFFVFFFVWIFAGSLLGYIAKIGFSCLDWESSLCLELFFWDASRLEIIEKQWNSSEDCEDLICIWMNYFLAYLICDEMNNFVDSNFAILEIFTHKKSG